MSEAGGGLTSNRGEGRLGAANANTKIFKLLEILKFARRAGAENSNLSYKTKPGPEVPQQIKKNILATKIWPRSTTSVKLS